MTFDRRCILSKFYIKPQRRVVLSLSTIGCILSKFYIKPQRRRGRSCGVLRCILSKFYIKPQPFEWYPVEIFGCILSKFYIKPQLVRNFYGYSQVVSYRNSTSNHNPRASSSFECRVVSYRNSTSNHNDQFSNSVSSRLYLIEILHQTTTSGLILIDKVLLTGCLPL